MATERQAYRGYFKEQMAEAKAAAQKQERGSFKTASPRLLFAGVAADSGTTAVHLAFLAAMKRARLSVQPFHSAGSEQEAVLQAFVSGRLPRLLDDWLLDLDTLSFLISKHSEDCVLSTMEGAGGFFDGLYDNEASRLGEVAAQVPTGSAAALALRLDYPLILIIRPRGSKQSVLAELLGYLEWYGAAQKRLGQSEAAGIRGVIFNEVAETIYPELKTYIEEQTALKVFGFLPPLPAFSLKLSTRALGDHSAPVWPKLRRSIDILAEAGKTSLDIDGLLALSNEAPPLSSETPPGLLRLQKDSQALGVVHIGVALDRCFFSYNQDNLELLAESGAKLIPISLLDDLTWPASLDALYMGGLYCPEMLPLLSHRGKLGKGLRRLVENGLPIFAEGQGAAYMSCNYYSSDGTRWLMSGALPYDAISLTEKHQALYSAQVRSLQIGAEYEAWEEAFLNQDEDLDNPRGISTWQVPYCQIQSRGSGLLLGSNEQLRALGTGQLTRSRACTDFQMATPKENSFLSGINRDSLHVLDARILFYSAPEQVLRYMKAGINYRQQK